MEQSNAIVHETELGTECRPLGGGSGYRSGPAIHPKVVDVFSALLNDAQAINYPTYESWAGDCGYDPDSRKGEASYRACLAAGLALRAALGDEVLRELQELGGRL